MGFRVVGYEEDQAFNDERQKRAVASRVSLNHGGAKRAAGHPSTSDRIYNNEEMQFLQAIEAFKARTHRPFPTWCEALGVLKSLGYNKVA